jgi:hypothetical protein
MHRLISVESIAGDWVVRFDQSPDYLIFSNGQQAEMAAKRFGQRFAKAGEPTEIRIYVRPDVLARRFICAPAQPSAHSLPVSGGVVNATGTATGRA